MMATLKERQIEIWSKEREIFDQTNELLTDVLHSLSPKQSKLLKGYNVDEYRKIVKIISPIDIKIEEDFGYKEIISTGTLRQDQQKEMLDFIFLNILHI